MATPVRHSIRKLGIGVTGIAIAGAFSLTAPGFASAAPPLGNCTPDLLHTEMTCTYTYTGTVQEFEVPEGVTKIDATAVGGHGGGSGGIGGQAATIAGSLTVTPDSTLYIRVGGNGGDATVTAPNTGTPGAGGWNGGGDGSRTGGPGSGYVSLGAGGGGASDIRSGSDLSSRLIVAGGGSGGSAYTDRTGAAAGAEGTGGLPGTPGTGTTGGEGGGPYGSHPAAEDGQLGEGGNATGDGSGGGGGYYGGGGGGNGGSTGGGGSSMLNGDWIENPALADADAAPTVTITYATGGGIFGSLASMSDLFGSL